MGTSFYLLDEEILALRWMIEEWGITGDCEQNCPFVYHYASSALEKLPNLLKKKNLCDHILVKNFYKDRKECDRCGCIFPKDELVENEEKEFLCRECAETDEW